MPLLVNPEGDRWVILREGSSPYQLKIDQGWTVGDQPTAAGVRLVTTADLDQRDTTIATLTATQAETTEQLAGFTPGLEPRVSDLEDTVSAVTTAAAPKPTPRTDALEDWRVQLEAWRTTADEAIADILTTVGQMDIPAAVEAWLTLNPPPAGPPGQDGADGAPGVDGKSAYQLARDAGYGGTQTQWLATLKGDKGDTGPAGTTDYLQLTNRPTLHAVATSGSYTDLADKPSIPALPNLATVASTGSYTDLTNRPTTPTTRAVNITAGALTANTAKSVPILFGSAMPSATYTVTATLEVTTATVGQYTIGILNGSKTAIGCTVVVRSTAAVNTGSAPTINVIAVA